MLFETLIKSALTPEPRGSVVVRSHVRAKPVNAKRDALHNALRQAMAS